MTISGLLLFPYGKPGKARNIASVTESRLLTPTAARFVFASHWTIFDPRDTEFGLPNHGGLTPAAPGCVFPCR